MIHRITISFLILTLAVPLIQVGYAQTGKDDELFLQTTEAADMVIQYQQDAASLRNFYKLRNSPERRERLKQIAEDHLSQLNKRAFEGMSVGGKVDYILLKKRIEDDLHALAVEEKEYGQISRWFPFAAEIYRLEAQRRRGAALDGQQIAAMLDSVRKEVADAMKRLEQEETVDKSLGDRSAGTIEGLQEGLASVHEFYNEYDPEYSWWVPEPYKAVDSVLKAYAALFEEKIKAGSAAEDGSGIVGKPIGHDELVRQLQQAMIPYTPEELVEIANKEFAWCDAEMLKASRELGFGDDWKAALEQVKNSYVPAGKQPELILKLYQDAIDFIRERDLITIPPLAEETWGMSMMSPERQLVNPFFLGGPRIIISYPTHTMAHEDKLMSMRGNNPYFSRGTVQHELIPGHNLQYFMNSRYKSYRRGFSTPFWTEGWALYWELLLYDMGFAESPEERIGMLFWRMHRCARIIFSLNFHLGKWTPQQCIDFLVDRVGHEPANAEAEVRRSFAGNYGPLYQLAYMIGGQQFMALKQELVDSGKMTYKEYHDAVMKENNMPIEMLRAILTGRAPEKDFKTSWRFYDE